MRKASFYASLWLMELRDTRRYFDTYILLNKNEHVIGSEPYARLYHVVLSLFHIDFETHLIGDMDILTFNCMKVWTFACVFK